MDEGASGGHLRDHGESFQTIALGPLHEKSEGQRGDTVSAYIRMATRW